MSKARDIADLLDSAGKVTADDLDVGAIGGRRNLIINGAMQVAQRGTSATGYIGSLNTYLVDRMSYGGRYSAIGVSTISQSTNAPEGFSKSLRYECTSADTSITSNEYFLFRQFIEAQDLQHLSYGTSNAKTLTISFWVRTSNTGTYILEVYGDDAQRSISLPYTVTSANTWEYKTLTLEGDTSGNIVNDNGIGLEFAWTLIAGPSYTSGTLNSSWTLNVNSNNRFVGMNGSLCSTVGNYFELTGIQVELGSVATPFEHRSYGEELALCQRYYQKYNSRYNMSNYHPDYRTISMPFPVTMRTTPSASVLSSTHAITTASQNSNTGYTGYVAMSHNSTNFVYVDDIRFDAEL